MHLYNIMPCSIQPAGSDELLQELTACDVIVYHVVDQPGQVQEASWAAQGS